MKKTILFSGVAAVLFGMSACTGNSDQPKTFADSLAYYMGQQSGLGINQQIRQWPEEQQKEIDKEAFLLGMKTVLDGDTGNLSYYQGIGYTLQMIQQVSGFEKAGVGFNRQMFFEEFKKAFNADTVDAAVLDSVNVTLQPMMERAMNTVMAYQTKERQRMEEERLKKFEANKKAGEEYIKKQMAADKSIKVTESGLAYKVEKMGTDTVAKDGDRVNVIYTGRLIDGKEFDSSKGESVVFPTRGVVPGFAEALTTFPAGTKVRLYIPENLGYGRQGSGKIEPGATLVFDVEIGTVVSPTPRPTAATATPAPKK